MERTADRPLPSGRLDPDAALILGVVMAIAGLIVLIVAANLLTALLGVVALVGYVFVYTPMKRRTPLATIVGAVPGAIPPMMGWSAVRDAVEPGAWVLFGVLFLWQLPHFLAIAWLCRDDFAEVGLPTPPVLQPDGRSTGRLASLYGAALVPVSLAPTFLGLAGRAYFVGALILGLAFLAFSLAFARRHTDVEARRLLLASVLYLPAVLAILLLDRVA